MSGVWEEVSVASFVKVPRDFQAAVIYYRQYARKQ
jgi:hypothetical protein